MCSCDSGDYPDFESWSYPRARKEYSCAECNGTIAIGERHEAYTAKHDEVETHRSCNRCVRMRSAFFELRDDPHCTPPFWELRNCVTELVSEGVTTWRDFRAAYKASKTVEQLYASDKAQQDARREAYRAQMAASKAKTASAVGGAT